MLQKLKRRILVHRKWLIVLHVCSSMKHASLSRQTVALLPLCFCTFHQNLFCTKTCLVPFVKPFPPFKLKSVLYWYIVQQNRFPMCVLHPGLWVKKHDDLSLCEGELLQWNRLIKIKILTVTLFWQFKACVLCQFFLKSLYIFKVSQGRKWNFNSERFWSHVIHTNCRKWKKVIHYWQLGKNKPWQKKPTDSTQKLWFYFEPCISW